MTNYLDKFEKYYRDNEAEFLAILEDLAKRDTPSLDVDLLNSFATHYADLLGSYVDTCEVIETESGGLVKVEAGHGKPEILVLTHMDTVWPVDPDKKPELKRDGNYLQGPGVLDMKASLVIMLNFFKAIKDLGIDLDRKITLLATPDEESGSKGSHDLLISEAKGKDAVIVLEFPMPDAAMKVRRKGCAKFDLKVKGKASHAGVNPQDGINAINEIAQHIREISALNDLENGTSVNFGIIQGGTARNVVPDYAEAGIDIRTFDTERMKEIVRIVEDRKPYLAGAVVEAIGGIDRLPMESSEASLKMAKLAQDIAAEIGFDLPTAETGGASDGNFTAALGVPTIDGLGVDGLGAHTLDEHILIDRIVPRQCLISELLLRI